MGQFQRSMNISTVLVTQQKAMRNGLVTQFSKTSSITLQMTFVIQTKIGLFFKTLAKKPFEKSKRVPMKLLWSFFKRKDYRSWEAAMPCKIGITPPKETLLSGPSRNEGTLSGEIRFSVIELFPPHSKNLCLVRKKI